MRSEAEIAALVVRWLRAFHWEVFQEVSMPHGIADIVARQNGRIWIVEVKKTLSLSLLAQADDRKPYAHWVSVAVPSSRSSRARNFAKALLMERGIGLFVISSQGQVDHHKHWCRERLNRKAMINSIKLYEEQKHWAPAGNADGARFSPFQGTCKQVLAIVTRSPGLTLKALVNEVDHHYASDASARSSLSHWIQRGIIDGVEARREGRYLRIYPCSQSPAQSTG